MYDGDGNCLPDLETISLLKKNIKDDTACFIAFGLYNNTIVKKLDLSFNNITDHGAVAISDCLKCNNTLKELNLSHNHISFNRMIDLSGYASLYYVNLSGNYASPWRVYCDIIKHCCANKLVLFGDNGMKEYAYNITDSLGRNLTLESLTICKIGSTAIQLLESILVDEITLKEINLSWGINAAGTKIIKRELKHASQNRNGVYMYVNILYDDYHDKLSRTIYLARKNIGDDAVHVITFGLHNKTTVEKLDLSYNHITINGMNKLSELDISLGYVDLHGNYSSSWGVYCVVIRHCCVSKLTLYGDEGMQHYVKDITVSLQRTSSLQSLTLCKIGKIGVELIESILVNNTTLKELNLSWGRNTNGTKLMKRQLKLALHNNDGMYVNILYDGYHECLSKTISLANAKINDDAVYMIAFGLCNNATVETLNMSNNKNVTVKGMTKLSNIVMPQVLNYVDLSESKFSPWGVYSAVIRHCCVSKLTLCGDEGMFEYVKEIADSLQVNSTLYSLTLCKIGRNGLESVKADLHKNTTLMELNMSWMYKGTKTINRKIICDEFNRARSVSESYDEEVMNINILYDGDHECSSEVINMSNSDINDDAVYLILYGLCNHATVYRLDFSDNYITDDGLVEISKYLEHNHVLKELNLSQNYINFVGMSHLLKCIKSGLSLVYVDLIGNRLSPWGVYCTIIRHCHFNSLTLCGDDEMMDYVNEITDSLETNTTLQSLTLCKIGRIGLQSIKYVLCENTTLKEVNLSWMSKGIEFIQRTGTVDINILYDGDHECSSEVIIMSKKGINDDAAYLISFGLCDNTTIQTFDLSYNNITDDGVVAISDCFRCNCSLHVLILSSNRISWKGAKMISEIIQVNKAIWKLDISRNKIQDNGAIVISECLKSNNTLQELNLSGNRITSTGARKIAEAIRVNRVLYKLDVSQNAICDDGIIYFGDSLKYNNALLELNLSDNKINVEGSKNIAEAIQKNTGYRNLTFHITTYLIMKWSF